MKNTQAIVVHNDFTNKHNPGHGSTINNFIEKYAARPGAIQSLPGPKMAKNWISNLDHLYDQQQFNSREAFENQAETFLKSEGISFDQDNLSLTGKQLSADAKACQQAYLNGHSVMKLVITFDTDYLIQQNVLDLKNNQTSTGKLIAQALPGGAFDLADQIKLRFAIQRGMNAFTKESRMIDPLWVGTIQFDAEHVHSHIACVDQGPLEKSNNLVMYNGAWQDRGKVLSRGRQAIRQGIDEALTFSKGLHRNTVNNQLAREIVKDYSANFDIRQQYQKQLANQLLFLVRLNSQRQQDTTVDDLYQQKLVDYRDSLVMQEAKVFSLPANMTFKIEQDLDKALDQQIQNLGAEGIPDLSYTINGMNTFENSKLGKKLQNQAQEQRFKIDQVNRDLTSWQYLINDYQKRYSNGQVGNGSFAMDTLYQYEFNRSLKQLAVVQAKNPLGLMDNYNRRQDLVNERKHLLTERESLLEHGYQSGLLLNANQSQLNSLLLNPIFKTQLVKTNQNLQTLYEPWRIVNSNVKAEDLPVYQDLVMKANSENNEFGVDVNTIDVLSRMPVDRSLVNALSGNSLSPRLRAALNGENLKVLNYDPFLKHYVNRWRAYHNEVLNYELNGVNRGLMRPNSQLFNSYQLAIPARIEEPLNVRSDTELNIWGYLDRDSLSAHQQTQLMHDLTNEQNIIRQADFYVSQTNQQSLPLINVKNRQQQLITKLPSSWQNSIQNQIKHDDNNLKLLNRSGQHKNSKPVNNSVQFKQTNNRQSEQKQVDIQRRILENVNQQLMNDDEADSVVNQSRRIVHQVLDNELVD